MGRLRNSGGFHRKVSRWGGLPLAVVLGVVGAWMNAPAVVADGAAAPVTAAWPVGDAGSSLTSAQCAECHATEAALSHPVKVAPTMAVPAGWPLEGGQINCTTCHVDTIGAHTQDGGALLRGGGPGGAAFCAQCHVATSNSRQSQPPLAIAQAHLLPAGGVTVIPGGTP